MKGIGAIVPNIVARRDRGRLSLRPVLDFRQADGSRVYIAVHAKDVDSFFLSNIRSLNTEIMSVYGVVVLDVGVVVVLPVVSIIPIILIHSLKTGFVTAGIDRETRNWQTKKKKKTEHSETIGMHSIFNYDGGWSHNHLKLRSSMSRFVFRTRKLGIEESAVSRSDRAQAIADPGPFD
jgi:hypothetical protein